jgi:hypothetical protein
MMNSPARFLQRLPQIEWKREQVLIPQHLAPGA